jgi:hypothetical protein
MKHHLLQKLAHASLLLGLGACAVETGSAPDNEAVTEVSTEPLVLAEAEVPGGKAQFLALADETILVVTDTVGVAPPMRDPAVRGLTIVETYEYWTGEAAPAALVARARQLPLAVPGVNGELLERETPEGVAATSQALSAAEFSSAFCTYPLLDFCWVDRTGTWEYERSSRYFHGIVDAVRGQMTVQLRRRDAFGWKELWRHPIFEGHMYDMSGASEAVGTRPLKFKIFDADGDHWHLYLNWYS